MKRALLLILALVLATASCKDHPVTTKQVQIIISNPATGPLQVKADPDPVTIGKGETVTWQIVYKSGPPLDTVVIEGFRTATGAKDPFDGGSRFVFGGVGSGSSGPSQTSGQPNKGGDFKYDVTVTVAGSAPVVFDPRLIVNY